LIKDGLRNRAIAFIKAPPVYGKRPLEEKNISSNDSRRVSEIYQNWSHNKWLYLSVILIPLG